jgi:hypothetical protein
MVLHLLQVWCRVSDIYDATKHPEVVHDQLLPMSHVEQGHAVHALHRTPVQHIYNRTHCFTPEPVGKALGLQHDLIDCHHRAIPALGYAILLRVVGCCVLTMHTLSRAVLQEPVAVNSPSRLVRSTLNFRSDSPSARAWISLIAAIARSLEGITATHMYLLRSSTSSKNFSLPLDIASAIGPHKSLCTRSKHRLALYSTFVENKVRHCFPT